MTARVLRGTRYVRPGNVALVRAVMEDLDGYDLEETCSFYNRLLASNYELQDLALLACNDRFFLLTMLLNRRDAIHPFVFARCREVERDPDGYLDLWARLHYKTTITTFAGILQETLINPELTAAIFSFNSVAAKSFLVQIKRECEDNFALQQVFSDVLWARPKTEAPKWSESEGLVFRRKGNPKEPTISAWGLIDGMPTGMHFDLLDYDDVIEKKHVTNPEMVRKATDAWELSDNLGVGEKTRKWHEGTRYSFADPYGIILERKILRPRIYAATHNGRLEGNPVYFTPKHWEHVKRTQRSTVAAQMLQNPVAGKEGTFVIDWLKAYEILPATLNVYIMCDPSKGRTRTSDNTAFAVVGIDSTNNRYLLDGARHRMTLSQRWDMLVLLWQKWHECPGTQILRVGYEVYGMQTDLEHFDEQKKLPKYKNVAFAIDELNWPREGGHSKSDRIQRLQPDMEIGKFLLPGIVWHEFWGDCWWNVDIDTKKINYKPARMLTEQQKALVAADKPLRIEDQRSVTRTMTKLENAMVVLGQPWRVPQAIRRRDEDGNVYDVTRALIEEMLFHPFGNRDDMVDVTSRIYDMEPSPAIQLEQVTPEIIDYVDA